MYVHPHAAVLDTPIDRALFYVAFVLYIIGAFFSQTTFSEVGLPVNVLFWVCQVAAAIALVSKLLLQRYAAREWLVALALIGLGLISYMNSLEPYFFWIILFVVCGKGVDIQNLAVIVLYVITPLLLITIVCALFGAIPSYYMEGTTTRIMRNSLGFLHPNRLGQYLFTICIAFATVDYEKKLLRTIIVSTICFLLCFLVCDSRSACVGIVIVVFGTLCMPLFKKHQRAFSLCTIFILVLSFALSMALMVSYNSANPLWVDINQLLTGRLALMHQGYESYGISLFGQECTGGPIVGYSLATQTPYYFAVDNAYAHSIIKYGLIPTVVLFLLIGMVFASSYRKSVFTAGLFGLVVLIAIGISEMDLFYVECNYFVVMLSPLLYRGCEGSQDMRGYLPYVSRTTTTSNLETNKLHSQK